MASSKTRKATVTRSISFTKKLDDKIVELSERLFQDNISATVGYIVSKYFDDMENGVQPMANNSVSTLNHVATTSQETPEIGVVEQNKRKKKVDLSFFE